MNDFHYDVLIIGAGPAGEAAAMAAAKNELQVAVVDARSALGGNCTHKGTIPSKSLRQTIKRLIKFRNSAVYKQLGQKPHFTYPQLRDAALQVIPKQVEMRTDYFNKNRIRYFPGWAEFVSANEVTIALEAGVSETIRAKHIVIATGSRPYQPQEIDFQHERIYDSDSVLDMQHTPRTLIIYGAGVIGCEYASIFAALGVKVDLINSRDRLLSFLDDEISDALSYQLRDHGVMVRHNENFVACDAHENGVELVLESGKKIKADAMLWCNGRTGNTDKLSLDALGLSANHRGQLKVNNKYQTDVENIYAAGDVIGWPSLASASYDQGRAIVDVIMGRESRFILDAPTGIYTLPEISSIGQNERELTAAKIPYEVGRAFFKDTARGQISGEEEGMLKILFHADNLQILGIHCFGAEASEIIHIGQAIMSQQGSANSVEYFVNTTFNYPTMAEAYRVAALNGLNRIHRNID
ncbi:Si-specific NAD(P)(+) transhydrogenase [Agaribacterium haliotis]|uniref:Si-specific NAD(P)(+) transhydrogenase n=1 Tax=Agaribacterium haliotis TaxID=2013869 RepID=UPI000BB542D5|nr:Si-specific NAD(P)(+) transhydrogenase [Agaribacterium haliotis]